jgi:hypothetical protein
MNTTTSNALSATLYTVWSIIELEQERVGNLTLPPFPALEAVGQQKDNQWNSV